MRWLSFLVAALSLLVAVPAMAGTTQLLFPADRCTQGALPRSGAWQPCPPPELSAARTQSGWIWRVAHPDRGQSAVTMRPSRFDEAAVLFHYADGVTIGQTVRAGDYGDHWRLGGTVLFRAPERAAALTAVAVGFHGAHWPDLLKATLGPPPPDYVTAGSSLLIGAAIAMLLLSIVANLWVGLALKRAVPLWNAAWAACVLGWAVMWTQLALVALPLLAGTVTARLVTFFAVGAIACAGGHILAATPQLGSRIKRLLEVATAAVLVIGWSTAATPGAWLSVAATLLNAVIILSTLVLIAACAACWKANRSVRQFAWSFCIPIAAVLWTIVSDRGLTADDDRGMYLVLVACALQTVWLALATGREVLNVRRERDAARESESRLAHIAETDWLTGLLNRRGFIGRAEALIARGRPFALILLDLDRFKAINDDHGHQTGDEVLRAVAHTLSRARIPHRVVIGRLGGEEFGILLDGEPSQALPLAEQLRLTIAHLPIAVAGHSLSITASFGIATAREDCSWNRLYKLADEALYRAKASGRNLVLVSSGELSNAA